MKNLINRVQLIGHLGKDVEIKELDKGRKVSKTVMATNEFYFDKEGEKVENTTWHNLVAWGRTAERLQSFASKGAKIAVMGKLSNRTYQDQKGDTRYITEIIVHDFMIVNNVA